MSEYREIQGAAVQSLASSTGTIEGQIWYDNVNGVFKLESATTSAAWSSGGNTNNPQQDVSGTGTLTAAFIAGGYNPSLTRNAKVENYDGTTWTASTDLPTATYAGAAFGTQTAGVYAAGNISPGGGRTTTTSEYDGSAWTAGGAYPAATQQVQAQNGGTLIAGIVFGGTSPTPSPGVQGVTALYDGSTWTTSGALNSARYNGAGTGTQASAVLASGFLPGPSYPVATEEYNGATWTSGTNIPEIRTNNSALGNDAEDFLTMAGNTAPGPGGPFPYVTGTLRYNGTAWSSDASITTARQLAAGTSQSAPNSGFLAAGNSSGGYLNATEEYTAAGVPETQTITTT